VELGRASEGERGVSTCFERVAVARARVVEVPDKRPERAAGVARVGRVTIGDIQVTDRTR